MKLIVTSAVNEEEKKEKTDLIVIHQLW